MLAVDAFSHTPETTGLAFPWALHMLICGTFVRHNKPPETLQPDPRYPDHGDFLFEGSGVIPK